MKISAKTQLTKNPKNSTKKSLIAALLLVLVAGAASYFAYHHHQTTVKNEQAFQADKARFAQVETDMRTAYDAMVAAAGKPDREDMSKSCSRTSLKFETGPITCTIYHEWGYGFDRASDASNQILAAEMISSKLTDFQRNDHSQKASEINFSSLDRQKIVVYLDSATQKSCSLAIQYGSAGMYPEFKVSRPIINDYILKCESVIAEPIYPLAQ